MTHIQGLGAGVDYDEETMNSQTVSVIRVVAGHSSCSCENGRLLVVAAVLVVVGTMGMLHAEALFMESDRLCSVPAHWNSPTCMPISHTNPPSSLPPGPGLWVFASQMPAPATQTQP